MLDVHPPEHGVHGLRDFLIHMLTITLGLLMAIGLENGAEALHHRHQREQAEMMIRQEIAQNLTSLKGDVPDMLAEYKDMQAALAFVQGRSKGEPTPVPVIKMAFKEGAIPDSAWRTASTTGVLSYMKYEQVQEFSDVYKEQDLLQKTAEQALEDYLQLEPLLRNGQDVSKLNKEDATVALPYVQHTLAHLAGMLAIGRGTIQAYEQVLKDR